jgi:hypothetical protein
VDAGQHPPVRRRAGGDGGVAAFGLEVGELGGEDLRLALGPVPVRLASSSTASDRVAAAVIGRLQGVDLLARDPFSSRIA